MSNMRKKGYLPLSEFANIVGRSTAAVNAQISNGKIKDCKKDLMEGMKMLTWWIHESEKEAFNGIKKVDRKPYLIGKVPQVEMEEFEIKNLKNFVVETGTIPFANMVLAVKMGYNRATWDEIEHQTGMKRVKVVSLIGELKMAEEKWPGKYKYAIDYLNAGRPCHPKNLDMRELAKKK